MSHKQDKQDKQTSLDMWPSGGYPPIVKISSKERTSELKKGGPNVPQQATSSPSIVSIANILNLQTKKP